jgi:hypothetical protein
LERACIQGWLWQNTAGCVFFRFLHLAAAPIWDWTLDSLG